MSLKIESDENAIEMDSGLESVFAAILAIALCLSAPMYAMLFLTITATYLRAFTHTRIIAVICILGIINSFFNIPTAAILYTTWNEFYRIIDKTGCGWEWCPVNAVSTHVLLSLEAWSFLFSIYYHWARLQNRKSLIGCNIWIIWTVTTLVSIAMTAIAPFISIADQNYFPFRLWCTLVPNDDEVKLLTASLLAIGHALPLAVLLCLNVLTLFTLSPNDQLLQKPRPIEFETPNIRNILLIALLQEVLLLPTIAVEVITIVNQTEKKQLGFARACAWLRIIRMILIPWLIVLPHKQFRDQSAILLGFRQNRKNPEGFPRRNGKVRRPFDNKVPVLFVTSDGLYLQVKKEGSTAITTLSDTQTNIIEKTSDSKSEKLYLEDENQINIPNNKRPTKTVRFSQNVSEISPPPETLSFISHNY